MLIILFFASLVMNESKFDVDKQSGGMMQSHLWKHLYNSTSAVNYCYKQKTLIQVDH